MGVGPPCHPVLRIGDPPRPAACRSAATVDRHRIVSPGHIYTHVLHPLGKESPALALAESHYTLARLLARRHFREVDRTLRNR